MGLKLSVGSARGGGGVIVLELYVEAGVERNIVLRWFWWFAHCMSSLSGSKRT